MRIQTRRVTDCILFIAIAAAVMRPADVISQAPPVPLEPTVRVYRDVAGASLKAYVFDSTGPPARGTRSAILLFHGGGWVVGSPEWTFTSARRYAAMGLVAVSVEYRLSNDSVTPIDALSDVCAAFQWVRRQAASLAIHPQRIAASGVSAGGHLAAAAGTIGCGNSDGSYGVGGPDALVLWSPALDVGGDGHFRRLLRDRAPVAAYSPIEHVRPRMPPVHIVHGERDTLTPLSGARRFCDRVRSGGGACELVVYPGVGHLLTRNLANQEDDFDPDPVARDDGNARQRAFIDALWAR
jgi:acetyl esterase/lipase